MNDGHTAPTGRKAARFSPGSKSCGSPAADPLLPGMETRARSRVGSFPFPGQDRAAPVNFFHAASALSMTRASEGSVRFATHDLRGFSIRRTMDG